MNKLELLTTLSKVWDKSKNDSQVTLDDLVKVVVTEVMDNNGEIKIPGLGTFKSVERYAHTARNPKTGEDIQVPAKRVLKFKAELSTVRVGS